MPAPHHEVACDESGSDGENLAAGNTGVFAHAGVEIATAAAEDCVAEARRRIRSPVSELKAGHFLRSKHRAALIWLLEPGGPLDGRSHVHVTDKRRHLLRQTVATLLPDVSAEASEQVLLSLHLLAAAGPRPVHHPYAPPNTGPWQDFLDAANNLLRAKPEEDPPPADRFRAACAALAEHTAPTLPGPASDLGLLASAAGRGPALPAPLLDPMVPAAARTALHWSRDGAAVALVHDRQNSLTPERVAQLTGEVAAGGGRLTGVRFAVAGDDARVQLADYLAGIARKIADEHLAGRPDPELTALLRPYLDEDSTWPAPTPSRTTAPTPAVP